MAKRSRTRSPLPRPPVGTYDPAIDASERAAQRGYRDLRTDIGTANTRAASDYAIGLSDIGRQRDYGMADLLRSDTRGREDIGTQRADLERNYGRNVDDVNRSYGRNLADLLTSRTRGTENYNADVQTLGRNYVRLGQGQGQGAAAAGVSAGGALAQALAKRTENEAIDRKPIDTNYSRFMADSNLTESRLGEDKTTSLGRLAEDRTVGLGQLDTAQTRLGEDIATGRQRLTDQYGTGESTYKGGNPWVDAYNAKAAAEGRPAYTPPGMVDSGSAGQRLSLDYQRGSQDRATQLQRGGRELNAYQQDLIPTRYYGAAGLSSYTPPKRRRR